MAKYGVLARYGVLVVVERFGKYPDIECWLRKRGLVISPVLSVG